MIECELAIIGGGPAGLAAALGAYQAGCRDILILERDNCLGGILNQCIHNGFGLHIFSQELTGPEYAERYIEEVKRLNIDYQLRTMVLDISGQKVISAVNENNGFQRIKAKAIVLAMGCRERSRGAINIFGDRPAGIFTAGTAQKYVNIYGQMPGQEVVVLGSGDIGLIMARRMTLQGARVQAVIEQKPYSVGLKRNIVQCLNDFAIPLLLSHTVLKVTGRQRLESVTIAHVDENLKPIIGSERSISCDTLLLSVGLLPENELSIKAGARLSPMTGGPIVNESLQTSISGIFACGNVLHVHDLVDYVSEESAFAGKRAADYVQGHRFDNQPIALKTGYGVRYVVPGFIDPQKLKEHVTLRLRVDNVYRHMCLSVYFDDKKVMGARKNILPPGEMETIKLPKVLFESYPACRQITITLDE